MSKSKFSDANDLDDSLFEDGVEMDSTEESKSDLDDSLFESDDEVAQVVETQQPTGSETEAFLRAGAQDLTFGLSDEIAGGLAAAAKIPEVGLEKEALLEEFYKTRDEEMERLRQLEEDFPKSYTAGQVAGTIGPMIATGGAAAIGRLGAKGAAKLAGKEIAQEVGEKAVKEAGEEVAERTFKDKALETATDFVTDTDIQKLAKSGALVGGGSAFGYSEGKLVENPEDILKDVATGAAIGAPMSVLTPKAVDLTGKALKTIGKVAKEGSKRAIALSASISKDNLENVIKYSDKLKKAKEWDEIKDTVVEKVDATLKDVNTLEKQATEMLPDDKVIPKQKVLDFVERKLKDAKGRNDKATIEKVQNIKDMIDPITPQKALGAAKKQLQQKINSRKISDDVVQKQELSYENALGKIQDKQQKMLTEGREVNKRYNFTEPKIDGDRIVVFETETGKVISEKIKPVKTAEKVKAQFTEPKIDESGTILYTENINTGEVVQQRIPQVADDTRFPDSNLSLKDIQQITRDVREKSYDVASGKNKYVNSLYYELSEELKNSAPQEYRPLVDEMHKRLDLVDEAVDKFKLKKGYNVVEKGSDDKLESLLAQIGKKNVEGTEKTDVANLLDKIEDIRGVAESDVPLKDEIMATKIKNLLESEPSSYNYAIRTVLASILGSIVGGPTATAIASSAALASIPATRKLLLKSKGAAKLAEKGSEIAGKAVDVAAQKAQLPATAYALSEKPKVAIDKNTTQRKLDDDAYTEDLVKLLEEKDSISTQGYADQIKEMQESEDNSEKARIRYDLSQQPAFRKLLKEYEQTKKK